MPARPEAEPRILVIGAGPAGLSAAVTAAELGVRVVLVDESPVVGGQYLSDHAKGQAFQTAAEREGAALLARMHQLLQSPEVPLAPKLGASVWSLEPVVRETVSDQELPSAGLAAMLLSRSGGEGTASLMQPRGLAPCTAERVQAGAVILATGARETCAPFPGWTLPGVMTVGGAQLLAKRHGVVPGMAGRATRCRVVLSGSGPLLLPAAARLIELGVEVVAVLEAAHPGGSWIRHAGALRDILDWVPALWDRFPEGRHYLALLRRHRVPYLFGRAVVRATANTDGHVAAVDVARLDRAGVPMPGTIETWPVDLVCVGHGLVPNIELALVAGARIIHSPAGGGWVVEVDAASRVRTSVPGLFVAGETAGIAGAGAALLSGRIAAMAAGAHLGRVPAAVLDGEIARTARRRRQHEGFGALLNRVFGAPDGLYRALPDDTPLCRCEEVTAGQVRAIIAEGTRSLDALKPALRVGQGLCQGRTCGPVLARLLAVETGRSVEASGVFQVRPPVRPVPLAAVAGSQVPTSGLARDGNPRGDSLE